MNIKSILANVIEKISFLKDELDNTKSKDNKDCKKGLFTIKMII